MVYDKTDYSGSSDDTKMAFDLRQTNAKIISMHWLHVCDSRKRYNEWFTSLRYFYSALKHDVKESRLEEYKKDFAALKEKFLSLINKNSDVYLCIKKDAQSEWAMQELLLSMEERLTDEITKSEMRGSYFNEEGL